MAAQHMPGTYLVCVCTCVYVCIYKYVCVCMNVCMYCNRPLDTEFPASVTKRAASVLYGPFSGMVQWNANTFLEISSLSQRTNTCYLGLPLSGFTANLRQFIHIIS